jgi:hypothetical protein
MPFDASRAANKAADYLQAMGPDPVTDRAKLVAYLTAIFQGMYDEQVANAEILPGTFTTPSGAVTGEGKYT